MSKPKTKEEIIEQMNSRKVVLSCSSLKSFTSPINFLAYKTKARSAQNAGMQFGSICDLLLLTPEDFDKKYSVVKKQPTTEMQKGFSEECIERLKLSKEGELTDSDVIEAYCNHYKKGDAFKVFETLEAYIFARATGKEVTDKETYDEAVTVTERLKTYPDVIKILDRRTSNQKKLEWIEQGFKMIGFLDFTVPEGIFDLKYMDDAEPEKALKQIYNLGYYFQGGIYTRGALATKLFKEMPSYHILAYDKTGNYSIIEIDYSYIAYGMRQFDFLLENMERCIKTNAWDQSFNFFKRKVVAFKPKWAKAYHLESEEGDDVI